MSKFGFVIAHLCMSLWMLFYYTTLMSPRRMISWVSSEDSWQLFWLLVIVCSIAGMCFTMKRHRTWFAVILHTLMPYGICTVLSYVQYEKGIIIGGLVIAVVLAGAYAVYILSGNITGDKAKYKWIMKQRIRRAIGGLHYCLSTTLAVFAVLCLWGDVFSTSMDVSASVPATQKIAYTEEETEEAERDFVARMESGEEELTAQERLDILQMVANMEQAYLGIPQTLTVEVEDMERGTCGYYEDYTWTIYVNREYLETLSMQRLLVTVCHEAYHAYQKRLVQVYCRVDDQTENMLMFREIKTYLWEFLFYIDGTKDFEGYYSQNVERDARDYAEKRVEEYYRTLKEKVEKMDE